METLFRGIDKGIAWLNGALSTDLCGGDAVKVRLDQINALFAEGQQAACRDDYSTAYTCFRECQRLAAGGRIETRAFVDYCEGVAALELDRYADAASCAQTGLEKAIADGNRTNQCLNRCLQYCTLEAQGQVERAHSLAIQCLDNAQDKDVEVSQGAILASLAFMGVDLDKRDSAKHHFDDAMTYYRSVKSPGALANTMCGCCALAAPGRDNSRERDLVRRGFSILREIDDKRGIASALYWMGTLALFDANLNEAIGHFRLSLRLRRDRDNSRGICATIERLAGALARTGQAERGATLFGGTGQIRQELGCPVPPRYVGIYEADIVAASAQLGHDRFVVACARGRAMSRAQVIDFALDEGA